MELLKLAPSFTLLYHILTVSSTPLPSEVILHSFHSGLTICKLLVFGLQFGQSHVIYVTPGDKSLCPDNSTECHTLAWYAHSNQSLITDNVEVRFLKGPHSLNTSIAIGKHQNITINGVGNDNYDAPRPISWIICDNTTLSGFIFSNSTDVHLSNLGFEYCGVNIPLCNSEVSAALSFQQGSNVSLHQIVVNSARGIGLLVDNVFGSISINESIFMGASRVLSSKQFPGNARIWLGPNKCGEQCSKTNVTIIKIESSWFLDGNLDANGLEIVVHCPDVYFLLNNVTIGNNRGKKGGNLALSVTDFSHSTDKSIVSISNSHIYGGRSETGGGMRVWIRTNQSSDSSCDKDNIHNIIDVYNTAFMSNIATSSGGAIYMSHYQKGGYSCTVKNIKFKSCQFHDNIGSAAAMEIKRHLILAEHASPSLHVSFELCEFHNNSASDSSSLAYTKGAVLSIILTHVVISNCSFSENRGTAISLQNSKLNVYSIIRFENNKAAYGAALKICDESLIFLHIHSHIQFVNNTALMGGAIFVQQACLLDNAQPCAFQPASATNVSIQEFSSYFKLEFINNSAEIAGDALYGGSMDTCYTIGIKFQYIFDILFNMSGQSGLSRVSSDPQGVCFCLADKTVHVLHHSCQTEHQLIEVYPGETFSISAVTVGQFNGSSVGIIQPFLTDKSDTHKLVTNHDNGNTANECTTFTFTLLTNRSKASIVLQPSVRNYHSYFNISFTVSLLPCPPGFELVLKNGAYTCDCHELIKFADSGANCNISTQTIQVQDTWLGCLNSSQINNRSTCENLAVSKHCGTYCLEHSNVSITRLDDQCGLQRTGIRCGECQHGLSHVLGQSPKCIPCSNRALLMYVPLFLLSGVILIFVLTILNITVTEGTLYGLAFYANIMFANRSLFPDHSISRHLWVFVSVVNLEPTRASCAYDGMTAYHFIWIRFGYVFYLLFIQVMIIFLSSRFVFLTRLFGKNVLKVLATLLFLSHTQLLYVCFYTFRFAPVYYVSAPNGTMYTKLVWYFDGNVHYLGIKHVLLFIVALLCSFVALLFMLSLLFIQCLQKWSDRWCLRWVERLRPFFEVYTGPCHNQHRFWPGFLYLMRSVLYALNMYLNSYEVYYRRLKMISTAAVCVLIMSLACIFPQGVYKKWPLNILEFSFLLNLCITSIVIGFHNNPSEVVCYSIFPVMILLCGILLYHIYLQIKDTRCWKALVRLFSVWAQNVRKVTQRHSSSNKDEQEPLLPQPLPEILHVNVIECPEPVLID